MRLDEPWCSHGLRCCANHMMLHMAGLDLVWVACNEWHVFALLVLKADLPAVEEFWPSMNISQLRILERPLQFATDNVFEAVVRDNMMVCTLVFDGYSLLHQPPLFELVAINQ